jgi:hypothetical protein
LHPWIFLICDMTKRKHENTNLLSQRTPFLLKKTPRTWIASFLFFLFPPSFVFRSLRLVGSCFSYQDIKLSRTRDRRMFMIKNAVTDFSRCVVYKKCSCAVVMGYGKPAGLVVCGLG